MIFPSFAYEKILWGNGLQYVAGVDEVGRGCFAGSVVAAAVILPQSFTSKNKINDSKKLSPGMREKLAVTIKEQALSFAIAEISVEVINNIGIGKAAQKAFAKAIKGLHIQPEHILIDAYMISGLQKNRQTAIVHGDSISISIAAASIIAKVYRDELMRRLSLEYEIYDFFNNKGYGTKKHREAIKKHGLCDLHRKSFNLSKFL